MNLVAYVMYRQNGGSGLNLSFGDLMAMEWADILFFAEKLQEFREEEAAAMKRT